MKIAFVGDSITQGQIGVSYVDMVQSKFPEYELLNYGKNGDSVKSTYKRCLGIDFPKDIDLAVLLIGVNDVFAKINRTHKVYKVLTRQGWAKSHEEFLQDYSRLLHFLLEKAKQVVVIPPLILGEDLDNSWNQELADLVQGIERIVKDIYGVHYLDVRHDVVLFLRGKTISDYIPISLRNIGRDLVEVKTNEQVDQRSQLRGLHLTLDGCHLNSQGAKIVAEKLIEYLDQEKHPNGKK